MENEKEKGKMKKLKQLLKDIVFICLLTFLVISVFLGCDNSYYLIHLILSMILIAIFLHYTKACHGREKK